MKNILKFIGLLTCLSPLFMSGAKAMEFFNDTDGKIRIVICVPIKKYSPAEGFDSIVDKNGYVLAHWGVSLEPNQRKSFDPPPISHGMKEGFLKSLQGFLSSEASLTIGASFSCSYTTMDNETRPLVASPSTLPGTRPLVASPSTLPGFVTHTITFEKQEEIDRALRSLVIKATKSKGLTIGSFPITSERNYLTITQKP